MYDYAKLGSVFLNVSSPVSLPLHSWRTTTLPHPEEITMAAFSDSLQRIMSPHRPGLCSEGMAPLQYYASSFAGRCVPGRADPAQGVDRLQPDSSLQQRQPRWRQVRGRVVARWLPKCAPAFLSLFRCSGTPKMFKDAKELNAVCLLVPQPRMLRAGKGRSLLLSCLWHVCQRNMVQQTAQCQCCSRWP